MRPGWHGRGTHWHASVRPGRHGGHVGAGAGYYSGGGYYGGSWGWPAAAAAGLATGAAVGAATAYGFCYRHERYVRQSVRVG